MSQYDSIDAILSEWAVTHSLVWLTDYQGSEVRTFFLNPNERDRVQVWVDPPIDDQITVHAFQSRTKREAKREDFNCIVSRLPETLNTVLNLAKAWLSE